MEGGSCDDDHHLILIMSEDVLIQILLWLPVISLLRFKSVCKSWRSIIESPFFIYLHVTTTTLPTPSSLSSTKLGGGLLFYRSINNNEKKKGNLVKGNIFTLSGEEFEVSEDLGEEFEVLKELEDSVEFEVVGCCCNGIICLHDTLTRNVALWNPAIKQSRILPKPSNLLGFSKYFSKMFINDDDGYISEDFFRFGIDIKTNDYKVLLITTFKLRSTDYGSDTDDDSEADKRFKRRNESLHKRRRVHVYSLSTDSWKCIDDATLSAAHPDVDGDVEIERFAYNQGLYLNGSYFFTALYWNIEYNWSMSLLLSFDFTEEIFRTIQPPFDLRNKISSGYVYFIRFGEKVALVDVKEDYHLEELCQPWEYDIWVLNEQHGVKESWTKFYTIGPPDRLPNQPLCITNNGEFAIIYAWYWQDDCHQLKLLNLQLLNLITGEKEVIRCDCENLGTRDVHVYKPSLVPVGGNGAAHNSRFQEFDGTQ